ncbi:MAG: acyl-CoA reductase [Bacteroidetes bacterium]|nr:MAG: acyl-CoA reductase [Bacteroidota bacterium]
MIPLDKRLEVFECLGKVLIDVGENTPRVEIHEREVVDSCLELNRLATESTHYNGWFDEANVRRMLYSLGKSLQKENLLSWTDKYKAALLQHRDEKIVGVVMAGNIPAVGFHDFLSVLMSGNKLLAKLSSDDNKLLPAIAETLFSIEPGFHKYVQFAEGTMKSFDAVIATGSNNTSRYFDYYFSAYPHIIRKNRNGVAVLTGNETKNDLEGLADDIFFYYGLGCRNVSKIFVPEAYDFTALLRVLESRAEVSENHKYFNNYEYNKAIYLVNGRTHFDTGNILLVEDQAAVSPVSVLHFEYYNNPEELKNVIETDADKIQCLVTGSDLFENRVPFGKTQYPELWDYADGIDTLEFVLSL